MDKLKLHTPDFTEENIARIAEIFPSCVTETEADDGTLKKAIDFDQLRQELSDHIVDGPRERYRLDWPGKREALLTANAPIAKSLRPCREESVDFDTTKNLYIEGDNLDALKLLQETYLNKVKMIYIDPPYNTGNDFVYDDDFKESSEEYFERSNQTDEEGQRLVANTEANGRFHSDWLSMMYCRLRVARNLLREDGVIFVSIDDGEVANLRRAFDEVFGEGNFIAELVWEGANKNTAQQIGISHEYVVVYAKNRSTVSKDWSVSKTDVEPVLKEAARLKKLHMEDFKAASLDLAGWFRSMKGKGAFAHRRFRFIDKNGVYKEDDPTAPGGRKFNLINPKNDTAIPLRKNRGWGFDQKEFNRLVEHGRISFITESTIMVRRYLHETDTATPQSVFYQPVRSASERLTRLLGSGIFPYPKDENILKSLVEMAAQVDEVDKQPIILDFFSGSATTAHAVMQLNAEDGGNRRHIMVQLPEVCDEKSSAAKAGYTTIAEIGKERIRRAGTKIRADLEAQLEGELPESDKHKEITAKLENLDTGFRVLKVDTSNMNEVYYHPDDTDQEQLTNFEDNIRTDRTPEDLLFQVLLDWGVDLALPITREEIQGKTVFFVDDNGLAACFDTELDETFIKELAQRAPLRAVFRDSGYTDDSTKINIEQIFKLLSPHTELRTL